MDQPPAVPTPVLADALPQLLARTEATVRRRLREVFAPGTHRFTEAIDADGRRRGRSTS